MRAEVKGIAVGSKELATFPNSEAACQGVWVPDIAGGFVPQGLALENGGATALVSGYLKDRDGNARDICRILSVNLTTGRVLGRRDFGPCGHAGGIGYDRSGKLWMADTGWLWQLRRSRLFIGPPLTHPGNRNVVIDRVRLRGDLKGSFLSAGPNAALFVGTHNETGRSRLYAFSASDLRRPELWPRDADTRIAIAKKAQGATPHGGAWLVSASTSTCGLVGYGTVASLSIGPGIEEIEFSGAQLWGVFEAGARGLTTKFYPLIARFDLSKLTAGPISSCNAH